KTALENGQQNVVYTVCKNLPYSKTLAWGAILGRQEEIDLIFTQPDFGIHKRRKSMYRAMAMAAHNDHFDIVNEKCGKEIFREDESSDEEEEEEGGWRGGREKNPTMVVTARWPLHSKWVGLILPSTCTPMTATRLPRWKRC
ncbi:hypothetical protein JG687_00019324, partial [Phytophthora cactorum]